MHTFKVTILTSVLAFCFANPAFAAWDIKDLKCPPVEQIQAEVAKHQSVIRCFAHGDCTYDLYTIMYPVNDDWLNPRWSFFMDFNANSKADAKTKAEDLLKSLVLQSGPTLELSRLDLVFCKYTTSGGADVDAIAMQFD